MRLNYRALWVRFESEPKRGEEDTISHFFKFFMQQFFFCFLLFRVLCLVTGAERLLVAKELVLLEKLGTEWQLLHRVPACRFNLIRRFQHPTFLKDTRHPLLVEGDPGVPVGNSVATAESSRDNSDQSGLSVRFHSQWSPVVASAGSAEIAAVLLVYSLTANHSITETKGQSF